MSIKTELKRLYTAMCGGTTTKDGTAAIIGDIADNYTGGGGGGGNILVATATVTNPDESTMTAVFNKTFGDVYNAVSTGVPVFFIAYFNEGMPVYFPFSPESVVGGEQIIIEAQSHFMGGKLSLEAQGAASANVTATITTTNDEPASGGADIVITKNNSGAWSNSGYEYEAVSNKLSANSPVNIAAFMYDSNNSQGIYYVTAISEEGDHIIVTLYDPPAADASKFIELAVYPNGTVTEQNG